MQVCRAVNRDIGLESYTLRVGRPEQQATREQRVPCFVRDEAHFQPMPRVRAGPTVEHEQIAALIIVPHPLVQSASHLTLPRISVLFPPYTLPVFSHTVTAI